MKGAVTPRIRNLGRRCLALTSVGVTLSGAGWAREDGPPLATLPGAPQMGLGCAFYANVPALTKVSGIQIVDETATSKAFVASIYGLRRGRYR